MQRGDVIEFGRWPLEPEGPAVPLSWQVLEVRPHEKRVFLLAENILDCRSFHDEKGAITWRNSSLRYWLNEVFRLLAFTQEEQQRIVLMENETPGNRHFGIEGGGSADDFVFCLSAEEVQRFLPSDEQRAAQTTAYARRASFTPWWWLRTPGGRIFSGAAVSETGAVDYNGFHATLECIGVRPALVMSYRETPEESTATCDVPAISYADAGVALRFGNVEEVPELLHKAPLRTETAQVALSGGWPSSRAVEKLLVNGVFSDSDIYHLCHAAVRARMSVLAKRIMDYARFDDIRLNRLLKAAVDTGNRQLTDELLDRGAQGAGYAAAYFKLDVKEPVALCAFSADPWGTLERWDVAQTFPQVAAEMVHAFSQADQLEAVAKLPGILSVLSAAGLLPELRTLVDAPDASFSREDLTDAIEAAKKANHGAVVAFLLDRLAGQGSGNAGGFPVMEL